MKFLELDHQTLATAAVKFGCAPLTIGRHCGGDRKDYHWDDRSLG